MRYAVISGRLTITQLQDEVKRCGGRNLRVATASKQVFCDLEPTATDKLRATGCIVSKVGGVRATIMPPIVAPPVPVAATPIYTPWEAVTIVGFGDLCELFTPHIYGEGFNMAIIDSGIRETHELIAGHVVYRKNFTSDPMRDGFSHGTGVASIVAAVAPKCSILNMKVLNDKGEGTEEEVVLAIDDCLALKEEESPYTPCVINLSLGSPDDGNPYNPLRVACRAAIESGIYVGASCGNSGPQAGTITCPACEHDVCAVGSAKYLPDEGAYIVSDWSSRGPTRYEGLIKPDLIMFGEDLLMASSNSDTATVAKSGTSFATPIISSFGLIYLEGMSVIGITHRFPGEIPWAGEAIPLGELMDEHFPDLCLRAEEVKSNEAGWGMVFGPLVTQAVGKVKVAVDISSVMTATTGIMAIGMLGMVVGGMVKGFR